jgi:hypothetical protein
VNAQPELQPQKTISFWDRVGLMASLICVVHCTLTPVFLFFLPVLGSYFESPWVHVALALIVFPTGIFAFYSGYQMHHHAQILAVGIIGFVALAMGLLTSQLSLEILFTAFGGVLLSSAHVLNLRACRNCHDHH